MGFMDIFKKRNNIKQENVMPKEKKVSPMSYSATKDGKLQIEYYHQQKDFKQFYDVTRLIVDNKPTVLENEVVYNCKVSWYNQDDVVLLSPEYEGDSINARNYSEVLAQIDPNRLQEDEDYCSFVMRFLLDRKRVIKYLEDGLRDNPENPCGKYIGGVRKSEKGYEKTFSPSVGRASHYSESMINSRKILKEKMQADRQRVINEKQSQIEKLQKEINDMSR